MAEIFEQISTYSTIEDMSLLSYGIYTLTKSTSPMLVVTVTAQRRGSVFGTTVK